LGLAFANGLDSQHALVSDALADHPGERPDQLSILSMPS